MDRWQEIINYRSMAAEWIQAIAAIVGLIFIFTGYLEGKKYLKNHLEKVNLENFLAKKEKLFVHVENLESLFIQLFDRQVDNRKVISLTEEERHWIEYYEDHALVGIMKLKKNQMIQVMFDRINELLPLIEKEQLEIHKILIFTPYDDLKSLHEVIKTRTESIKSRLGRPGQFSLWRSVYESEKSVKEKELNINNSSIPNSSLSDQMIQQRNQMLISAEKMLFNFPPEHHEEGLTLEEFKELFENFKLLIMNIRNSASSRIIY